MKFPYLVTVNYIINKENEVLLQKKRRGFGQGKWNGPGGKIDQDETPRDSAIREVKEETRLIMKEPKLVGEIEFIFTKNNEINNYCYVFRCNEYEGSPIDTGEGELRWFEIDKVPYEKMWDDDKYWLKEVLNGGKAYKRFYFDDNGKVIKYENTKN